MCEQNNEIFVALSKIMMIFAGFWKRPVSKNWLTHHTFNFYSIFIKFTYLVFWLLLVAELFRLILGDYPSLIILTSFSVVVPCTKVGIKMIIYIKRDIFNMFNDIIEKEQEIWNSNEDIQKLYRANIRICRIFVATLISVTAFASLVLLGSGGYATYQLKQYNEANNVTLESHFMYLTWFPRDKLNNLFVTFLTQLIWSYTGIIFTSTTQIVFVTLMVYSASRLQILQVRLKNFIGPEFSQVSSEKEMNEHIEVLKSLIAEHISIIGFVEHLNDCTKNMVLMEYTLSSLDVASVTVNLIKNDASQIGWLLLFFVLLALQILILAWTCNEIKIQSEAIGDALYASRWYLLNKEGRKLTQIIIARAQKPLQISIGAFGPMTTNSAILIFKASYSFLSVMK